MYTVIRKTIKKRFRAKLKEVKAELKKRMHDPIPEVGKWLRAVVGGHNRYYGVPMNNAAIHAFRFQVGRVLVPGAQASEPDVATDVGAYEAAR